MTKDFDHNIQTIRTLVENNEERNRERAKHSDEAIKIALEANNRRLDTMNEFRSALSDQNARMMTRVEALAITQQIQDRTLAEVKPLADKITRMSQPNYAVWGGFSTLIIALCTGAWVIFGLQVKVESIPFYASIETFKVELTQQDHRLDGLEKTVKDAIDARREAIQQLDLRLERLDQNSPYPTNKTESR